MESLVSDFLERNTFGLKNVMSPKYDADYLLPLKFRISPFLPSILLCACQNLNNSLWLQLFYQSMWIIKLHTSMIDVQLSHVISLMKVFNLAHSKWLWCQTFLRDTPTARNQRWKLPSQFLGSPVQEFHSCPWSESGNVFGPVRARGQGWRRGALRC